MTAASISRITVPISAPPSVLVVDDDADFRRDLLARLAAAGMKGEQAHDVAAARAALARQLPDVMTVDRPLPDGDGFALCESIKGHPTTHFIPVLGVSGDSAETARLDAAKAGFDHWLPKPVDVGELVVRINVLARTSALHRATASKADGLMMWRDWVRFLVHDLRNPVNVAIGNLALALRRMTPELERGAAAALAEAHSEMWRVVGMLQDLLDTDRLQRGVLALTCEPCDLAVLARKTSTSMHVLAAGYRTTVVVDVSGDTCLEADRALLERVLANLAGNALRYARKAPVFVQVDGTEAGVTIRVVNDGPGIPLAIRDRIFVPWVVVSGGAATGQGTGLGLAFCRLVVEAHRGRIWIDSADDGHVAFAVFIPRRAA